MRTHTIHKKEIILNKENADTLLAEKDLTYAELFRVVKEEYGLDMEYKSFMNLISNRVTWKLLYAWAMVEALETDLNTLFKIVEIDIEKAKKDRAEWKAKYANKDKVDKKKKRK